MGMFDTVSLIEFLPCYECSSTANDEVGSFEDKSEIILGGKKLNIVRLHDGKGGIKSFQTKDLICTLNDYYFPGFIPDSDMYTPSSKSLSDLIEICNCCETIWEGELFLEYDKSDDIHITTQLNLWADKKIDCSDLKWKVEPETRFYEISVTNNGRIIITPKIEIAIQHYLKQKDSFESKISVYKSFLDSIKEKDIPKDKIVQLLEGLVEGVSGKRKTYANKLAQSIELYTSTESMMIYTRSALEAALVILYHYNQKAALEIVDMSGLSSEEEFIKDLKLHDWFFNPDKDSGGFERICGIIGGPNYFLDEIKSQ